VFTPADLASVHKYNDKRYGIEYLLGPTMSDCDVQKTEAHNGPHWVLIWFTLFVSFYVGEQLALLLHESGHALGGWLGGLEITRMVLQPAWTARVEYSGDDSTARLMYLWGAFVFASLSGLLLVALSRCFKPGTTAWLLVYATGTMAVAVSGVYLFRAGLTPTGDILGLLWLATSRILIFLLALPLLAVAAVLFIFFLEAVGLRKEHSCLRWVVITESALLSHFGLILASDCMLLSRPIDLPLVWRWGGYPATFTGFMAVAVMCGYVHANFAHARHGEVRWSSAAWVVVFGLLVILIELRFFSER
jgi:hypothetical protein